VLPSVLASQVRRGIEDFLRTTFPIHTPSFDGVMERLLDAASREIFTGPYVSVKLPFRPGTHGRDYFPDVPLPFPPYLHQEQAFQRLRGATGRSTIIATGTGSGKTECFLYPLLDYCWQKRGEPGIKAIVIYPMNALATDQAKRFARVIHDNTQLRGTVRVGLYIGDQEGYTGSMVMTADQVITHRETMRLQPPDILLTNYKMLDYLMIRPADTPIWKENGLETLKYIVVDELHTFDGAQGTDLACLLRRLKARLRTPQGYLCCVGTSATLGGLETTERLRDYASQVFGEPFEADAIIGESVLQPQEFFGDSLIDMTSRVPEPNQGDDLQAEHFADIRAYLQRQAELWCDMEHQDIGSIAWRLELGERLLAHVFFRNLLVLLHRRLYTMDELVTELERVVRGTDKADRHYRYHLLVSMLALISSALVASPDGGDARPFLQVCLQLWMRELRRLVCRVGMVPEIRFADDLTPEQHRNHLPLVHCRECGETGWLGAMRQQDEHVNADLQHIYEAFFQYQPTTHFLFPGGQPLADADLEFGHSVCGQCLHIARGREISACASCGTQTDLVPIWRWNPRVQTRHNRLTSSHNCPYCGGQDSLTIMGSQAASLISVGISQLFASIYNDDRKLLAFSDSVQDAAHRAGFFGARTYRFNFRAALQQYVARLDSPVSLAHLPQACSAHYQHIWDTAHYLTTFLPPDMVWLDDYEYLLAHGRLPEGSNLLDLLAHRIAWEIPSEYAFRSRIGRTLEKTGSSVAGVDLARLAHAADAVLDTLRNEIGGLQQLRQERLMAFINGFLTLLKTKGAVFLPPLQGYVASFGGYYMLGHGVNQLFMPHFGRHSRTPVFLTTRSDTRFDQLVSRSAQQTWYQDWALRCLGDLCPYIADFALALYAPILSTLVQAEILEERQVKGDQVWGWRPEALRVYTTVHQYRCNTCGHNVSIQEAEVPLWEGSTCLRLRCTGHYQREPAREDYYGHLYATGHIQRLIPAEHTALLERAQREQVEQRFITREHPWDPNLLSCTPTLEMGIDIGDLSSAVLCSVPPSQASYLQRIGRTGRRDGNAFTLTVANGRPHDLYFYAQPLEMLAGVIEPPGCFLSASAVLERQFTAFCFDHWVQTGIDVQALPRKLGVVLNNLTGKNRDRLFPYTFLTYIELHRSTLFEQFVALFDALPATAVAKLRSFVEGDDHDRPGMRVTILQGLEDIAEELKSLRSRVKTLRQTINKLKEQPVKDATFQEELDQLEIERSALASIARSILDKDTYNFFTDEGLLPNYAFPEAGILLRSVILRRKQQDDGRGQYKATVFEYERPAVSAIHELAPSNQFYAEGRKVTIDQIDMRLSDVEEWRFCNACPHMALAARDGSQAGQCPRCGSAMWADDGQVCRMIKMRQVIATTTDRESRIQDDSDERTPEFFHKQMLVEVETHEIMSAYSIESADMPFGFEYVQKATFREINFGNRSAMGDTLEIAGRSVPRTGFVVCRRCGKVGEVHRHDAPEAFTHAVACPARKSGTATALLDCIYLYREFSSEAIRMLLPVASFAGSEQRLQSFIAAIILGLKYRFRGNIDHLEATVQEEPFPDTASLQKKYLVLYDRVPGGTGYLKELSQSAETMMDVFADALALLQRCECREAPLKDGCYRCVYAYRTSFDMPHISRRIAIQCLSDILQHRDRLVPIDTITRISQSSFIESELEAYLIEALHRERYNGLPVQLRKEIVHHKTGWYCKVNDYGYYIEPQVELSTSDGVPITTRPDFVFYPERQRLGLPIAVYLDGFAHHAHTHDGTSRVGDDMAKRMGLVRSGHFHVWSLTWKDVESRFSGENGYFAPVLPPMTPKQKRLIQSFDKDTAVGSLGDMNQLDSFALLVRVLGEPHERAWQTSAAIQMLVHMDMRGCDSDDIVLELERLLGEGSPWVAVLSPAADARGLVKGTLADAAHTANARLELLTWVSTDAISRRALEVVQVVGVLHDVGDMDTAADFKQAWNGFLRLYNLLQFLPALLLDSRVLRDQ
jgi:DEAD/DEAH box helicase domain-containing protein